MPPPPSRPARRPVRVVFATRAILPLISVWRAAALVFVEFGLAGFFAAGVAVNALGPNAVWVVLVAVLAGLAMRAVDLEAYALVIPGGLYGTVKTGLGRPAAKVAAAALLVDYLAFGALAALVAGQYLLAVAQTVTQPLLGPRALAAHDLSTALSVALIVIVWLWHRQGRAVSTDAIASAVRVVASILVVLLIWAASTVGFANRTAGIPWPNLTAGGWLAGLGYCLFLLGSVEALGRLAPELPQPRVASLSRTAALAALSAAALTVATAVLFVLLVPANARFAWTDMPLKALAVYLAAPTWLAAIVMLLVVVAAGLMAAAAVHRAGQGAQSVLLRLSEDGVFSSGLRALHHRFGTPWRVIDTAALAQIVLVLASAGRVSWLARAYAVGVAGSSLVKIAAVVRFRLLRRGPRAYQFPLNVAGAGRQWPAGLVALGLVVGAATLFAMGSGDPASIAGAAAVAALTVTLAIAERANVRAEPAADRDEFQFLQGTGIDFSTSDVRPGGLLVPVRRPHFLAHLAAAMDAAEDRDVVAMTVRLIGTDVADDLSHRDEPTEDEKRIFSGVVAMAERRGRAVRLLIVPATNVFDALAQTAIRLGSSEIYVGESETLSADDQAHLLGDAWERSNPTGAENVRLVIHHRSGRSASYLIGAHAPALTAEDHRLIHSLWLDVVKTVGPHVHHHDVVRAALKQMEEQLNSDDREVALKVVREVARPADELAAVVHARDFIRLRDIVRNRRPGELAELLTDLPIEDQVLVFRTIPRREAAATFEYLSHEAQESLLKAMAQEDIAALLNSMAPDDRTMFLEELPASATRQLLSLLTPHERAIASTLLGYPEKSIGRLMTPDYVAVREHWTVPEVLDYVRTHGQDSETLNVLYVVDDQGVLIDDVRIRDVLLAPVTARVADLMDRRFVALKAADAQETAVAVFRDEDRSALPVTDSAGVLIGIVTVDDVMDVAEAIATKEIQKIGGSEALDEPYISISFGKMLQKRAGWLTVLFLGEMLTASAMGAFEHEIERALVLALFVPLIISSGGNSGSQASSLVIRAIALGELQLKDWWRVMRREAAAGLALGVILGTIGFLRVTLWSTFSTVYGPHWLLVGTTVAIALVGVVLWGTLVGSLLPFLLRRLGFDPATSSAPFVATLVDVTGLIIYFGVGLVVLKGTLL